MPTTMTRTETDRLAYDMRTLGMTWSTIASRLGMLDADGLPITTTAIGAAHRHADRNGLPRITRATARRQRLTADAASALRGFGIEIECRRPAHLNSMSQSAAQEFIAEALRGAGIDAKAVPHTHRVTGCWKVIYDGSSDIEVVSPILHGDAGHAEVRKVMAVLTEIGCTVGQSEGMHVHVDVRDMTGAQREAFVRWYARTEIETDLFFALVAPSRLNGRSARWCRRVATASSHDYLSIIRFANGTLQPTHHYDDRRYHSINTVATAIQGSVEFRLHQGSLNGRKATAWVALCTAVIEAAKADQLPTSTGLDVLAELVDGGFLAADTADYLRARAALLAAR